MAGLKRVIFFAQDEGSAKALAPVIRSMPARAQVDLSVVAGTYAARIFGQCGIPYRVATAGAFGAVFSPMPDLVVAGASMRASIEKEAIGLARKDGIKSVTLLDSRMWLWWRFTVDGARNLTALPDYILVPDPACKEQMISEQFPAARLVPTGNPHFDTLLTRTESPGHALPRTVLVVTQPQYKDGIYQSDLTWLKTVLTTCRRLDPDLSLTIRPHSKEDPQRFDSLLSLQCQVDADSDIVDLIESHQLIIGKNSSALFEAALLGKRVISFALKESDLLTSPMAEWDLFHQAIKRDDLEGLISEGIKHQVNRPVPRDIPYYTDGRNGERVINFLMMLLKNCME
jgi:hypothetical protein